MCASLQFILPKRNLIAVALSITFVQYLRYFKTIAMLHGSTLKLLGVDKTEVSAIFCVQAKIRKMQSEHSS